MNMGGVPATVGIIDGEAVVGMTPEEIEEFGKRGLSIPKVSRRDIPVIIAIRVGVHLLLRQQMILAAKAGVEFFVTGGIGGVHRGAETTFDISADLEELGNTNLQLSVQVLRLILDLPKTLEILETKGVPVLGFQNR